MHKHFLKLFTILHLCGPLVCLDAANYYINDGSTNGDVYTTSVGVDSSGRGTNAATPMLTLTNLLASYDLEPGDVVYVDSGTYTNYTTTITSSDAGLTGTYVTIQGSTNRTVKTVLDRTAASSVIRINSGADYVRLSNLELRRGSEGVLLDNNSFCDMSGVTVVGCTNAFLAQGTSSGHRFTQCTIVSNRLAFNVGFNWRIDNCTLFGNFNNISQTFGGGSTISNSIVVGGTLFLDNVISGDFNVFWNLTLKSGSFETLDQLQSSQNAYRRSIVANPEFPQSTNGFDSHVSSVVGRFNPSTGAYVTDSVHSVAVDFGDDGNGAWTNEAAPNGSRIDAGTHGGTGESSKSRTNLWLLAISYNDGGTITSTGVFRWSASKSFTNGSTVKIDVSSDDGVTYSNIVTGVPVTNSLYTWTNTLAFSTLVAHWRVVSESDASVADTNDNHFVIRNGSFTIYVNDTNTVGDSYCSAAGAATNTGLSAASPLDSIQTALNTFDLGAGDVILVDAGTYTQAVTVGFGDSGASTNYSTIQGSTNLFGARTLIQLGGAGSGFTFVQGASFVRLRNLQIRNATQGVLIDNTSNCEFDRVWVDKCTGGFIPNGTANNHKFLRCVTSSNTTAYLSGSTWQFDQCVFYNNANHIIVNGTANTVSNSVFVGGIVFPANVCNGDFSIFWNTTIKPATHLTLNSLQKAQNSWWRSAYLDPGFVIGTNFDLHVRSAGGRFDPATASFVYDTNTSPCVDGGDPASLLYTNETSPNGVRLNSGFHGGTFEASRTPSNGLITALTYNDGGTLNVGESVYWNASAPSGSLVQIEYSGDGGGSWIIVASNIAATAGSYTWTSTNETSSQFARYRVVLQSNTNVFDGTETNFLFRNGPFVYYVNDGNITNDMYTSAVGNDSNLGTAPGSPKATLTSVLNTYDLDPGDIVYVDTGRYPAQGQPPVLQSADSGVATSLVRIVGSTNYAAGGTVFDRQSTIFPSYGVEFSGGSFIELRNVNVTNAYAAFRLQSSPGVRLVNVEAVGSAIGFQVDSSSGVVIERSIAANNTSVGLQASGSQVYVDRGILYRNGTIGINADMASRVAVSNSIVTALGGSAQCYVSAGTTNISGNYNAFEVTQGAVLSRIGSLGRDQDTLSAWTGETGSDTNSIEIDPLFANAAQMDFHLKTQAVEGRYDPFVGLVSDGETSPLIDAGDPTAAFSNEPSFNGGRMNIGTYGNTAEASKSRTALSLVAASMRQGGWVRGTATLHWVANNFTNGALVNVEISTNGGISWVSLSNNALASAERVVWNTTAHGNTPAALWRVASVSATNVYDETTNFFAIRNGALAIYVNDASTANDAFTSAPGAATNYEASASRPLNSLDSALALFDIEPGDTIYLDTGTYTATNNVELGRRDGGGVTGPVVTIVGSTNACVGETILARTSKAAGSAAFTVRGVSGVVISNVVLQNAFSGLKILNATNIVVDRVTARSNTNGFELSGVTNFTSSRLLASFNGGAGIVVSNQTYGRMVHSVSASNRLSALEVSGGSWRMTNCIMTASGSDAVVIQVDAAASLRSDYNDLFAYDQANVARVGGILARSLSSWQARSTNDLRSLAHNPLFVDASAGNFHVRSEVGRFNKLTCADTADPLGQHSPTIDTGDPSSSYGAEPVPHGNRVNMGLYGDDTRAALSRTNGWLLALNLNDGGSVRGTNALYWIVGGPATGHTVRLEYSVNNGVSWTNIQTNLPASSGQYLTWDSTQFPSTPLAKWRVVSEADTNIFDEVDTTFSVNNGALTFYVNDSSTNCDVYCTAPGNVSFDGLTPGSPARSVRDILNLYELVEGDRIFVDAGVYTMTQPVQFGLTTFGTATNPIVIQGSTNEGCGATIFSAPGVSAGIDIQSTAGISVRDISISGARSGIRIQGSTNITVVNVQVYGQSNFNASVYGYEVRTSTNISFHGCSISQMTNTDASASLFIQGTPAVRWINGLVWSNFTGIEVSGGGLRMTNSIIGLFRAGAAAMQGSDIVADYNCYVLGSGVYVAAESTLIQSQQSAPILYPDLASWIRARANDRFSLTVNPKMYDPAARDFHLLSEAGRYEPGTGFVLDGDSSLLIDAGDPATTFTNEPAPNGGRINIGPHGNSPFASKSPAGSLVTAVSFNDGGIARGTNVLLYWLARGSSTASTFTLQYTANPGDAWTNIVTNLAVGTRSYIWNTTNFTSSLNARWRVVASGSGQSDSNDVAFALRNTNFSFYVNDASQSGDVFTGAPGSSTNTGLSSSSPLASIGDVLGRYDLEGGDTLYVDTGSFTNSTAVSFLQIDAGEGTNRLQVLGSTNGAAGGTTFYGSGLSFTATRGVDLRNIAVNLSPAQGGTCVSFTLATNSRVSNVSTKGGGVGLNVGQSTDIELRYCVVREAVSNGLLAATVQQASFEHGVLWSNGVGAAGAVSVSNSVIAAFGPLQRSYGSVLPANYNSIFVTNGAIIGTITPAGQSYTFTYRSLGRWVRDSGQDRNSLSHYPALANPQSGDFHLLSEAGRFDPGTASFVFDGASSLLIDGGAPSSPYANETSPNGDRVNIGLYGNTPEASRTPATAVFTAATLSDGGRAEGTNVLLYWVARGAATSASVRVEFSGDAGETWTVLASNVPATQGSIVWNSTGFPSTVRGVWKVSDQSNTNVFDRSDKLFALRNGPVPFYVNNQSTAGDVYCSAVGSPTNNGVAPNSPKLTITNLLAEYDIESGDIVYVDTGVYTQLSAIVFGQFASGNPTGTVPVIYVGSTNAAAGGTILDRAGGDYAISVESAGPIVFRNFNIRNAQVGVRVRQSLNTDFDHVNIAGGQVGVVAELNSVSTWRRSSVRDTTGSGLQISGATVSWVHGVLWSNGNYAVDVQSGALRMSNSVVVISGANRVALSIGAQGSVAADFNNYWLTGGAIQAVQAVSLPAPFPLVYQTLSRWARDTGRDRRSLSVEPGFVNPAGGDFHLMSAAGRYDVSTGLTVTDAVTSLLIDAGDPQLTFTNEPSPNGRRINMGPHGDSSEASRTPTNARLLVVSLNDGGRAEGSAVSLNWLAYGAATGHTAAIAYSADGGTTWSTVATGIPARAGSYVWDSTPLTSSIRGVWRLTSETDGVTSDTNDTYFALRNTPLSFYVNDGSSSGDMYTLAAGTPSASGVSPSEPRDSVQSVLDSYDLEPGDTIYIDTCDSLLTQPISISRYDAWDVSTNVTPLESGQKTLTFQGSTNTVAGGSLLRFFATDAGIVSTQALGLVFRDIRIQRVPAGAGQGIRLNASDFSDLRWIRSEGWGNAFDIDRSDSVTMENCLAASSTRGLYSYGSLDVIWRQGVLWSNRYGVVQDGQSESDNSLTVENTSISAFGSGSFCYFYVKGLRNYNFNNLHATNGAYVAALIQGGTLGGGTNPIERTYQWTLLTGQDGRSLSKSPDYANPNAGDFHLLSPAGRFVPGIGYVTNALERQSKLLDAGNPASSFTNEPAPNASRVEIGLYGGTSEASKSPSNGLFQVITLNDGFSLLGTVTVYWAASGPATSDTATLQFSSNGGVTWSNIATNVIGGSQGYTWNTEPFGRACAGKWRIFRNSNTNVVDTTDRQFALRNGGSIPYYVNATLEAGDVYTTASGNSLYDGCLPSTPKASLQDLIDNTDLEPGDVVNIDGGVYPLSQSITIGVLDAGSPTNPVVFQGSTNLCSRPTVFDRQIASDQAIHLRQTEGIEVRNLIVRSGAYGVFVDQSANSRLTAIRAEGNAQYGVRVSDSTNVVMRNSILVESGSYGFRVDGGEDAGRGDVRFENGVIWDSPSSIVLGPGGHASVVNSALEATGENGRNFYLELESGSFSNNYNNLVRRSDALIAERARQTGGNELFAKLVDWQRGVTQDIVSLSHEPLFADELGQDFHLKSPSGRVSDCGDTNIDVGVRSPLLDTGDPTSIYTNEPPPNGDRINIGAYGNTKFEARSASNAWLLCVNPNDGGLMFGTQTVYWVAGGMAASNTVTLLYASDGVDYNVVIASNVPAYQGSQVWNLSSYGPTVLARWKVRLDSNPSVEDAVDQPFFVKNGILDVYVNDESTNGDVFCTAPGNATNSGLTAAQPLLSIAQAFTSKPISAGDTVYVDTGTYYLDNFAPIRIGRIGDVLLTGVTGFPLTVLGSTASSGTTVVALTPTHDVLQIDSTRFITISNLKLQNGRIGLSIENVENVIVTNIDVNNCATNGIEIVNGRGVELTRATVWQNGGQGLHVSGGNSDVRVAQSVIWSNRAGGFVSAQNALLNIRNSIIGSVSNTTLMTVGEAPYSGNYNLLFVATNSILARDTFLGVAYQSLLSWQRARGVDTRSIIADPLFADPTNGDFHVKSEGGRYYNGTTVTDAVTSWAIDVGDPAASCALEPVPNGNRLNVGRYGNTAQASITPTNPSQRALYAVTATDGGLVTGTQTLYWVSRGFGPSDMVYLEFSTNGGQDFVVIATNINVNQDGFVWDPTSFSSTPRSIWKVTSQTAPLVSDTNDRPFTLRLGPIQYYVNDGSTTGDVYTTAAGSPANDGLSPGAPKDSIMGVLTNYDLEGSPPYLADVVYVDGGVYVLSNDADRVLFLADDQGTVSNRIRVLGSTNALAQTVLMDVGGTNSGTLVRFFNADSISMSDFVIDGGSPGIEFANFSTDNAFTNILIRGGGEAGVKIEGESSRNAFTRLVVTRNSGYGVRASSSSEILLNHSVLWSNAAGSILSARSTFGITNSVLHAYGSNTIYTLDADSLVRADFNNLYVATNTALYAYRVSLRVEDHPGWTALTTQDVHSISADPLFADPGADNFTLLSPVGRYDFTLGTFVTTDTNLSYLVDGGSTGPVTIIEQNPNGNRVNIGRYGNTPYASKSRTNDWLLAVTASSGGRPQGIFYLVWNWGGMAATNPVAIDYSYDGGDTWQIVATNIPVSRGEYLWNSYATSNSVSPEALWRVRKQSDTNVYDITDNTFILNGPITFYINDTSTACDVYTTAIGSDTNLGYFPYAPKATLKSGLETWLLKGGDTVVLDTGYYPVFSNNLAGLDQADEGLATAPVTIMGSDACERSVLYWGYPGVGPSALSIGGSYVVVTNIHLLNLGISAGGTNNVFAGLSVTNGTLTLAGSSNRAERLRINRGVANIGGEGTTIRRVEVLNGNASISGKNVLMENSIVASTSGVRAVVVSGTNITLRNNTIVSRGTALQSASSGGQLTLRNNILVANGLGAEAFVLEISSGLLDSDYNNLVARNGAWIGNANGNWEKLQYWQRYSGRDANSISADPLFYSEAAQDFHLQSVRGRFLGGFFIADAVHSPSIDSGDPSLPYAAEPTPNGLRANQGAYGNTEEASMSREGNWVSVRTVNDGGVLKGTNAVLTWTYNADLSVTNHFTLQYSPDGGATWSNIVSGIPAQTNRYTWNSTPFGTSFDAYWRIVLDEDTNVVDANDQAFALRNAAQVFFVNDALTGDDVYTSAAGSPANDGRSPSTPLDLVNSVLTNYDLEAGDAIYVDTGSYTNASDVLVYWSDGGDETGLVEIRGSTNFAAGGSIVTRGSLSQGADAFEVRASHMLFRDLTVRDSYRGVYFNSNRNSRIDGAFLRDNVIGAGFDLTVLTTVKNSRVWNNSEAGLAFQSTRTTTVENVTFVDSGPAAISVAGTFRDTFQNNIFQISDVVSNTAAAYVGSMALLDAATIDYNIYFFPPGMTSSYIASTYTDLAAWQKAKLHDYRSAVTNPLFADASSGDFQLKSEYGRLVFGVGITNDAVTSWGIDTGNPATSWTNEPSPNGGRVNIGAYGGSPYASLSSTSVYFYARSGNQFLPLGSNDNPFILFWQSHLVPTSHTVKVQYSGDNGVSWYSMATNVPSTQEYYIWTLSPFFNTYTNGRWRVISEQDTSLVDTNDANIHMFFGEYQITAQGVTTQQWNEFIWRGAWGEDYQIQYADKMSTPPTSFAWSNAPSGFLPDELASRTTTNGGDLRYVDVGSSGKLFRVYRVLRLP